MQTGRAGIPLPGIPARPLSKIRAKLTARVGGIWPAGAVYWKTTRRIRRSDHEFGEQSIPSPETQRTDPGECGGKAGGQPPDHLQVGDRSFP